jgi:hypothetical protein
MHMFYNNQIGWTPHTCELEQSSFLTMWQTQRLTGFRTLNFTLNFFHKIHQGNQ